jgi:hypothetical protein
MKKGDTNPTSEPDTFIGAELFNLREFEILDELLVAKGFASL